MTDLIKRNLFKGIVWYRLCLAILAALGPISVYFLQLWLQANFVTVTNNTEAWQSQVRINERLREQANSFTVRSEVAAVVDQEHERRLNQIDREITEQRRILTMPRVQ